MAAINVAKWSQAQASRSKARCNAMSFPEKSNIRQRPTEEEKKAMQQVTRVPV